MELYGNSEAEFHSEALFLRTKEIIYSQRKLLRILQALSAEHAANPVSNLERELRSQTLLSAELQSCAICCSQVQETQKFLHEKIFW